MGDDTNFVHEEPDDLQCLTMIWATCVVEDVSKNLDILALEFKPISEQPSFLPECKPTLRRLLVRHNLVALR